jgi:hypothetical protein
MDSASPSSTMNSNVSGSTDEYRLNSYIKNTSIKNLAEHVLSMDDNEPDHSDKVLVLYLDAYYKPFDILV